jgi:hypothetical protein
MKTYWDDPPLGVSYPADARPSINANHIDGPLLVFRDGQMHWLNLWERLLLHFGWVDAEKLEKKLRPHLAWLLERRQYGS